MIHNLIPDHQAHAFHLDAVSDPSLSDKAVQFLIGGFSKWDAAYFLHISQYGYTQEQMFAFFPVFPVVVRVVADYVVGPVQHMLLLHMSLYSCVLVAAVAINIVMFCSAAVLLYYLGIHVLCCERLAYRAALLFSINPASVFMTAAYTESLFAMVSFAGMLSLEHNKLVLSVLLFALSGAVRSNGLISIGFLSYYLVKKHTDLLTHLWDLMSRKPRHKLQLMCNAIHNEYKNVIKSICLVPCFLIIPIPFVIFQMYSFMVVCTSSRSIASLMYMDWVPVTDNTPLWCRHSRPLPYAAIQSKHWNVGFLRYYELKQVPNFLLALPMVILCVSAIIDYCKQRSKYVCVLGIIETDRIQMECRKNLYFDGKQVIGFFSDKSFVYMGHMTSLIIFGVTCMHVQVRNLQLKEYCKETLFFCNYFIIVIIIYHNQYVSYMCIATLKQKQV